MKIRQPRVTFLRRVGLDEGRHWDSERHARIDPMAEPFLFGLFGSGGRTPGKADEA